MTDKTKNPASQMFDQALENYEQVLRTGLKFQEEAGRTWTKLLSQSGSPEDWQKQMTALTNEVIPATQKNLEAYRDLLEQNGRASVELLKKGSEAAQTTNLVEGQGKLVDFYESAVKSLKANAQAIVEINCKAVDSWIGAVKKVTSDVEHKAAAG